MPDLTELVVPPDPWPNQEPVVDGVTPVEEVSQDPNFFKEEA